jgi:molybdenum cofactor guanylyltransferase
MIGIYSCLKRSQTEVNLVISCDMPLVPASLLEYLLSHSSNQEAIVPIHSTNRIEPLCGVYKRSLIPLLEKFIKVENYSIQQFLNASQLLSIEINSDLNFFHKKIFSNINTLEDFNSLSH